MSDVEAVTDESDEGNLVLFNKKLSKLLSKARLQDGTCGLRSTAA